jgi:hypothetical protein
MTNQLTLTDTSQDEKVVVQQFMQAAREIAPTVEISLAKRIMRPGSNKVLCLAAHTSVPLNEDELGSVSDLALRLSDGTNVKLSVSFFNDTICGATDFAMPYRTYTYHPERYVIKSDSRLGTVLAMTSLAAAAAFFYVVMPALPSWLHSAASTGAATAKISTAPTDKKENAIKSALLPAPAALVPLKTEAETANVQPSHSAAHRAARLFHRHAHAQHNTFAAAPQFASAPQAMPHNSMFVPPPPPLTPFFPGAPAQLQNLSALTPDKAFAPAKPIKAHEIKAAAEPATKPALPHVTRTVKPEENSDTVTTSASTAASAPVEVMPPRAPRISTLDLPGPASAFSGSAAQPSHSSARSNGFDKTGANKAQAEKDAVVEQADQATAN